MLCVILSLARRRRLVPGAEQPSGGLNGGFLELGTEDGTEDGTEAAERWSGRLRGTYLPYGISIIQIGLNSFPVIPLN